MAATPADGARRPRLRISRACQACRLRKAKCDGARPACARCHERREICTYSRDSIALVGQTKRKPRGRHVPIRTRGPIPASLPPLRSHPGRFTSTSSTEIPSTIGLRSGSEHPYGDEDQDADPDQKDACYTAHSRFAGEVAAAIDASAGLVQSDTLKPIPFVDAPLFGELDLDSPAEIPGPTVVLPPRADADKLVGIYWQYIDPAEPVLDRTHFFRDYNQSYSSTSGRRVHADPDIWLSTLNAVFALAVQRQESTPLSKRYEDGSRYFRLAWLLLRPETILWKAPSLEVVQCLMLLNRYLHCTNNRHKTWMTAGLAACLAQSTCYHHSGGASIRDSHDEGRLKRRVWASCVSLDRCVSWSLGRATSLLAVPNINDSPSPTHNNEQESSVNMIQTFEAELLEIGNQIQLAQTQTRNRLAARLGLPRLYQQDEYHSVAVQLDACLKRWEDRLPENCRLQNLRTAIDRPSREKGYFLHIRFLHTRIFLYRPLLATFYKAESHRGLNQGGSNPALMSLSGRLLRECAAMCIETVQNLASIIIETLELDEPIGLLPWWYRVYYLHIAGTNLLAAMFAPDLFNESVSQSWGSVMSALRAHAHLSTYIPQCIRAFETLSARTLEARCPNPDDGWGGAPEETPDFFEDIFHDVDFDFDSFLFGSENSGDAL